VSDIPQGLKPWSFRVSYGTAEAVPCYKALTAFLRYKVTRGQERVVVSHPCRDAPWMGTHFLVGMLSEMQILRFAYPIDDFIVDGAPSCSAQDDTRVEWWTPMMDGMVLWFPTHVAMRHPPH
jgi:hypothetical protein